ncbi:MAG: glycoside hydrolase family 1 protein [bacterium]|nr:glycoside hydrolase family 1 protein [bacterium]
MAEEKVPPKHDHATLEFPQGFLWGAATSAHQVEGNNTKNDWWDWEQGREKEFRSGEACDQYRRYEEDFDLAKELNHNSHRLSLEWSRIEPEEGKFDLDEIEHYVKVLKYLKSLNFTVMLTLHHFTNPQWLAKKGGWENSKSAWYFERFVKTIVPKLKDYVDMWITINEPQILVWGSYIEGCWPPQKKSTLATIKATWNLVQAHKKAYKAIHKIIPEAKVGIAQNVQSYTAYHKHSIVEQVGVIVSDFMANHIFYTLSHGYHDFLGLNYYLHHRLKSKGLKPELVDVTAFSKDVSDLGWEIFPEGIFDVLTDLSDGIPIYITECGIATTNDDRRIRFLMQYLQEVYRAIQAGVKVKGFFYWSLLDNFEWAEGFDPKFGLVEVDLQTKKRVVKPSAKVYADIVAHNGIRHELMKFLGHRIHVADVLEEKT